MSTLGGQAAGGGIYGGDIRGLNGKAALIYEELERRIVCGTYRFGATIPTLELTREFNVSRAPLTAALNQLRFEGYVEITPQVGSRVIDPTRQQIADYFVMFGRIEEQLARFAAARRTAAHCDAIARLCDEVTAISESLDVPSERYLDIVDLYHMAIRQAAQSPLEVRRVSGYFRFAAFLLMNGWPEDFRGMAVRSNRNRPLVSHAIIAGDVDGAGKAMLAYISEGVAE